MEETNFQVRTMSEDDAEQVAKLALQLGYASSTDEIKKRWKSISTSASEIVFVLTSQNNDVIGFAHIGVELGLTNPSRTLIRSLVVDEKWRSKALGSKFLNEVEEKLKNLGHAKIRVGTQVKRTDAHRFYQKAGFQLLKVWNVFEKKLE